MIQGVKNYLERIRGTIQKAKWAKSHLKNPQISCNISKKTVINFDTAKKQKTTRNVKSVSKLYKKWYQNAVTTKTKPDNKPKMLTHVVVV